MSGREYDRRRSKQDLKCSRLYDYFSHRSKQNCHHVTDKLFELTHLLPDALIGPFWKHNYTLFNRP